MDRTRPEVFEHLFRVHHQLLFEHRPPHVWIFDVLEGLIHPDDERRAAIASVRTGQEPSDTRIIGIGEAELRGGIWSIPVIGPEWLLSTICVMLNQHAGQHPNDTTPEEEALRLEATLHPAPLAHCARCSQDLEPIDELEAMAIIDGDRYPIEMWQTLDGTWACNAPVAPGGRLQLHVPVITSD